MSLSLIAAVSENNCIGKQNALPWYLPEDLKHFKTITTGKVVLMGRKTWESLPEKFRPLPNRINIIITRQTDFPVPESVFVFTSIEEAVKNFPDKEIMVIGGAEIFRQTIDKADTLYITEVKQKIDGDVFFPEIDKNMWKEIEREDHPGFSFLKYIKKA